MRLEDVARSIDGEIVVGQEQLDLIVDRAFAADLLSDVLALTEERTALITGMTNPQVMRVAEILNIIAVVFVRGKTPPSALIEYAERLGIPIVTTKKTMFETCGLMFAEGVRACRSKAVSDIGAPA